jgi:hypothetical protein
MASMVMLGLTWFVHRRKEMGPYRTPGKQVEAERGLPKELLDLLLGSDGWKLAPGCGFTYANGGFLVFSDGDMHLEGENIGFPVALGLQLHKHASRVGLAYQAKNAQRALLRAIVKARNL